MRTIMQVDPRVTRFGRIAVVILAAVLLWQTYAGVFTATGKGYELLRSKRWQQDVNFEGARAEYCATVPKGASVFIHQPENSKWYFMLIEITVLCGTNGTLDRDEAEYEFMIASGPNQYGEVTLKIVPVA
jgi:hypothetical protein